MINDPYFRLEFDKDGSSPAPQVAIWRGQHTCVTEGFSPDDEPPSPQRCGEIIVKHQLAGDRGHYSVLQKAFISIHYRGFPHSVVAQITRHQDSSYLVQSSRYTGKRFISVAEGRLPVEEAFYFRPCGDYTDRSGAKYRVSDEIRQRRIDRAIDACHEYADLIELGYSEEDARDVLPYSFRQNFNMAGTYQAFFHWLDQRSSKAAQREIQTVARLSLDLAKPKIPEIADWYEKNRFGKARLAP